MARDTDSDWRNVAEENPYWGVLSAEEYRGAQLSEPALTKFFATGAKQIGDILGFVRRHVAPEFEVARSLDFGCGVGRLLIPLAKLSQRAVGIDVAPRMLDLARRHAVDQGLDNTELVLSDDGLSGLTGTFNFINSYIVLQHIPPPRGIRILRKLLTHLEVGGVFSFQLTYAKARRFFHNEAGRALYYRQEDGFIRDLVATDDAASEGAITMFDYDLNEVMLLLSPLSAQPIMTLPTNHDGHMGVHFLGLKASHG